MRAPGGVGRAGSLLALGAFLALPVAACRADDGRLLAGPPLAEAARATSRKAADLRRTLEEKAAKARDDLDAARRSAEGFLSSSASPTRRQAEAARAEARRALTRGEDVLARAAEDGSRTAETWARVIQDRMMRLEETLNRLTGAAGHADS
jgi:ElaB/YqjD/DUF883 family membrane-anchored ribosome-binding protein